MSEDVRTEVLAFLAERLTWHQFRQWTAPEVPPHPPTPDACGSCGRPKGKHPWPHLNLSPRDLDEMGVLVASGMSDALHIDGDQK